MVGTAASTVAGTTTAQTRVNRITPEVLVTEATEIAEDTEVVVADEEVAEALVAAWVEDVEEEDGATAAAEEE